MPKPGKAAASTALPQPPSTSQKVPMNSATRRMFMVMGFILRCFRSAERSLGGHRLGRSDLLLDRRQLMGNALVAVDAGHALVERDRVRARGAPALLGKVHVLEVVAVAAFL